MATDNEAQRKYWERRIGRFDAVYDDNQTLSAQTFFSRLVESGRKSSLRHRFELAAGFLREMGIAGKSVIDGGCGAGRFTGFLLSEGIERVYAIDIAQKAIAMAQERIRSEFPQKHEKVTFISGDIATLSLPKADYLVGLGLVEYLSDVDSFASNIRGSSRYVLINYPSKYHWKRIFGALVAFFEDATRQYYSSGEMKRIFEKHAFVRVKSMPFGASILDVYRGDLQ